MGKGNMNLTVEQLVAFLKVPVNYDSVTSVSTIYNTVTDVPNTNTTENTNTIVAKPSNRCAFSDCKKKLLLSDTECKCSMRFCSAHRMSELHACTFDYKAENQKNLEQRLVKVGKKRIIDDI
jgi:predicted nucleic acid binding AN1-type Zn finger protein